MTLLHPHGPFARRRRAPEQPGRTPSPPSLSSRRLACTPLPLLAHHPHAAPCSIASNYRRRQPPLQTAGPPQSLCSHLSPINFTAHVQERTRLIHTYISIPYPPHSLIPTRCCYQTPVKPSTLNPVYSCLNPPSSNNCLQIYNIYIPSTYPTLDPLLTLRKHTTALLSSSTNCFQAVSCLAPRRSDHHRRRHLPCRASTNKHSVGCQRALLALRKFDIMNAVQTMPSPVSPYAQQYKQHAYPSQRPCFPPSPVTDSMSPPHSAPAQGLGLYACSMPATQQSTVTTIMASPQSESWTQAGPIEQEYTTSQPPDIFSAAFDPFSGFSSSSTTGMVGPHSPEAPGLEFCQTPPSSNLQSHRGSVSSYAPSDASDCAYTPRVKPEDQSDWYQSANEHVLQRAMSQAPIPYPQGTATLASQTDDIYRSQHTEWTKNDTEGYITELHTTVGRLPRFDMQPVLPSLNRIKKKRQRTTPEEATHECKVCGKLFKRSYNWKSHMETHNPERKYPHMCTAMIGDTACTKKFQRKTDLDRHHDSVSFSTQSCSYRRLTFSRCISRRAITNATFAAIDSLAVILSGGTPKMVAPSDLSSVLETLQPRPHPNSNQGGIIHHLHILHAPDRSAWESPKVRP